MTGPDGEPFRLSELDAVELSTVVPPGARRSRWRVRARWMLLMAVAFAVALPARFWLGVQVAAR